MGAALEVPVSCLKSRIRTMNLSGLFSRPRLRPRSRIITDFVKGLEDDDEEEDDLSVHGEVAFRLGEEISKAF